MAILGEMLSAGSRAQRSLRDALSRNRRLALWRCAAQAAAMGRKVVYERDEKSAVVYDERWAVRVSMADTGAVWEAITGFPLLCDLALPSGEWRGPDGSMRSLLDLSTQRKHTLKRSRREFVFTSLPESDATNELYLQLAQLSAGGVVLDCGAYCGASTCAFADVVGPGGRVIAFEPDAENFAALAQNVARHAPDNVTLVQKGIWSESTTLRFAATGTMGSRISTKAQATLAQQTTASIETMALADVYRTFGLERLDFIKMDIEGAEIVALAAAAELLQATRPRLVVEAHIIDGELATGRLLSFFEQIGFFAAILLENSSSPYQLVYAVPRDRK